MNGCLDVDECSSASACDINADCINSQGSYGCVCNMGYTGDGLTCQDVDECSQQPCVFDLALCFNTVGSFHCDCKEGYKGTGITTEYYENYLTHLLPNDYFEVSVRDLTRQELPAEENVNYWECVGEFSEWSEWAPGVCPCDTMTWNHTRSCGVGGENAIGTCDWKYCDWIDGVECTSQEPCDTAPCPEPPVMKTTASMNFEVSDDIDLEGYCGLLDSIKKQYGFPEDAKIKLDVGEFTTDSCE